MSGAGWGDELRRYDEAVRWLESFIRPITGTAPQKTRAQWIQEGPPRLARMEALLAKLDHPERRYLTLHVTGTSGKGSVCTYLGSVLRSTGLRTGVHATPYLQAPVEKLQVNGRYITPARFADLVAGLRQLVIQRGLDLENLPYPALSVALTYLFFAQDQVDAAVIEVSTGGRFDWTNTITPVVSVVTTVGPDHLIALGPTLADVAYHKAGIIKPDVPAVTGVHLPELGVIEAEAVRTGSRLVRLNREFTVRVRHCGTEGTVFDYAAAGCCLSELETGMLGRYQVFNAGLAVAALQQYGRRHGHIDETALRTGLREARLPGRMELIQSGPDVMLDGAHNPEKAAALASAVAEVFPDRRLILVVGALSTKDATGIFQPFVPGARLALVTSPHVLGKPGADPERIAAVVAGLGLLARVEASPAAAMHAALAEATPDDLILVTGSLYLVGEVRRLWIRDEDVVATGYSSPGGRPRPTSAAAPV